MMIENIFRVIIVISTFIWIGFVCAISFMEAWLKFRAQGVTLPIGLSIGKLIFKTLNRVEWAFATLIFFMIFIRTGSLFYPGNPGYGLAVILLIIQTGWLLPALDKRANARIKGAVVPSSSLHRLFVSAEIIKIIALFSFGLFALSH